MQPRKHLRDLNDNTCVLCFPKMYLSITNIGVNKKKAITVHIDMMEVVQK